MKTLGYCTAGKHVRYVTVTQAALDRAAAKGNMVEGVCDTCRREAEKRQADPERLSRDGGAE